MIDGFHLYIHERYEGFIHSNVIPREHDIIDYKDRFYTIVTVRHYIRKDEDTGDASIVKRVSHIDVYAII